MDLTWISEDSCTAPLQKRGESRIGQAVQKSKQENNQFLVALQKAILISEIVKYIPPHPQ